MNNKKTISSFKWSAIEKLSVQIIQLGVMLILAKLLGPEAFSLIGMLSIFIAIAQVLTEGGVTNAIIRKENRNKSDFTTAFYFNITTSITCYFIIFFSSPYIALFYEQEKLELLIKIISLVVIINSFSIIPKIKFSINLDFKNQARASLISVFFSSILAISTSYLNFGVWALVIQSISYSSINCILLNCYSKWYLNGLPSKESLSYLFKFGSKLIIVNILDAVFNNIYQVVIGKSYPLKQVGYYSQANTLAYTPSFSLTTIIIRVIFPLLSKEQNNKASFISLYIKILEKTSLFLFPIILSIGIIGFPFISIVLGSQWENTSILLLILAFSYITYPIYSINTHTLQIKGYPGSFLKIEIIRKILICILLLITAPIGVTEICIGIMIQSYITLFISMIYINKKIKVRFVIQLKKIITPYLITIICGVLSWWVSSFYDNNLIKIIYT